MVKIVKKLVVSLVITLSITLFLVSNIASVYATSSDSSGNMTSSDWRLVTSSGSNDNSFGFIKNNKSNNDDGKWMLYGGIGLIVLSVMGVVYVIFSSSSSKKKYK